MEYQPGVRIWKDGKLWDQLLKGNPCHHKAELHPAVPWNQGRCLLCQCPRCFDNQSKDAPYWWPEVEVKEETPIEVR